MKKQVGPSLFDLIDQQEAKEHPEEHECKTWKETRTQWPGDNYQRPTWTCIVCGFVKGRCL